MQRIAIFASGTGSNARKIIEHFQSNDDISVDIVISNKKNAKVLDMAAGHGIDTLIINRASFYESKEVVEIRCQPHSSFLKIENCLPHRSFIRKTIISSFRNNQMV